MVLLLVLFCVLFVIWLILELVVGFGVCVVVVIGCVVWIVLIGDLGGVACGFVMRIGWCLDGCLLCGGVWWFGVARLLFGWV